MQAIAEANRRIEIYSGFERVNSQKVKINLTVDLRPMLKKLNDYQAQLETLIRAFSADVLVEDRALICRLGKLEMLTMCLEEDVHFLQVSVFLGNTFDLIILTFR